PKEHNRSIEHVIRSIGSNSMPDCAPNCLLGSRELLPHPRAADPSHQRAKGTLGKVSEFRCDQQASMPRDNFEVSRHWRIKHQQRSDGVPKSLQLVRDLDRDNRAITLASKEIGTGVLYSEDVTHELPRNFLDRRKQRLVP